MGSLPTHSLIDGQQRLTTLQLVIDATAAELEAAGLTSQAQQLANLTHNIAAYSAEPSDLLKVRHHNDDRHTFVAVMSAVPPINHEDLPPGRIRDTHQYFAAQVREFPGDPVDLASANALVSTLTQGLQIVVISLADNEPSQEIFETLNARGTPLTAADLIKNYVFQQISAEGGNAERAYRDRWRALELKFWEKEISVGRYRMQRLSLFFNHWLVAKTGEEISTRSTFTRFKSWFEDSGQSMRLILDSIHAQAALYFGWADEASRKSGDLAVVPMFIYRTEAAEVEAVKPLLLWLFDVDRALPRDISQAALADVESWVMRRALIRRPASEYSRVVATLMADLRDVPEPQVAVALRAALTRLNRPEHTGRAIER